MLKINANAKINLFLEITGKMENGYHSVDTVMQSVSLADSLEIEIIPERKGINIACDLQNIPTDEGNIVYKTARAYFDTIGADCGVSVKLHKAIPSEAGMGGGSADGAAVLLGLNELCGRPLDVESLELLAARYGADIPFCVAGGTKRLLGIGTETVGSYDSPDLHLVIAKPDCGISTPMAYKRLDAMFNNFESHRPASPSRLLDAVSQRTELRPDMLFNRFEDVLEDLCPISKRMIDYFKDNSHGSLLCGSGAAVFAIAENAIHAQKLAQKAKDEFADCRVWTATTASFGCTII